jgi:hypothetical protein
MLIRDKSLAGLYLSQLKITVMYYNSKYKKYLYVTEG